jgi:hypothetical protein
MDQLNPILFNLFVCYLHSKIQEQTPLYSFEVFLLPVVENPGSNLVIFFLSLSATCSGKSRDQPRYILSKFFCYLL